MPSGPIGSCWAEDSWEDTAWEANAWEGSTPPVDEASPLDLTGTFAIELDIIGTV